MPIPTPQPKTSKSQSTSAVRNNSTIKAASTQDERREGREPVTALPAFAEDPKSKSSISRSRVTSRPNSLASAVTSRARPTSSKVASSEASSRSASATVTATAPSRASSTSSTASRPRPTSHQHATPSAIKPKTTTTRSRIASISTSTSKSTTLKPATSQVSRIKPTSTPSSSTTRPSSSRTASTTTSTPKPDSSATSHLRTSLYQLQLLHSQSQQPLTQYQTSITRTLTSKQSRLQAQQSHLLFLEARANAALNLQVLDAWLSSRAQTHDVAPAAQIQTLSSTIAEIDQQLGEGSELLEPLSRFERWMATALSVREERNSNSETTDTLGEGEVVFVEALGRDWHEQMRELRRVLSVPLTTVRDLGEVDGEAGLGKVIARHRRLLSTLVQEVDAAIAIERAIMDDERVYEADLLGAAMAELSADGQGKENTRHRGRMPPEYF